MRWVAGVDVGYGWTKVTSSALANEYVVFPTVVGDANRDLIVMDQPGGSAGNRELNLKRMAVRTEFGLHYLGDLALQECDPTTIRTAAQIVDRVQDEDFAVLLRTSLALALGHARSGSLVVVTGLPLTVYRHERDRLRESLQAQHTVTFVDPATGEVVRSHVIDVPASLVVPQPIGSYADLLLGDGGEVRRPDLLKRRVAVLDIGFGTSDLLVVRPGMEIDSRSSSNIPGGVSNLVRRLQRDLQADETFRRLQAAQMQLHELEPALRSLQLPGLRPDRPEAERLRKIVARIKADASHTMVQRLEALLGGSQQPDVILLTGGGCALLSEELSSRLQAAFPLADVIVAEEAQTANTRGYRKLAMQFAVRRGLNVA